MNTSVNICGVKFNNPVIAASGTFGFGEEYAGIYDLGRLGGISVKGLSLKPRDGNPPPRIAETPSGMLNAVGLQNPGIEVFIEKHLPRLRACDTRVIANITGTTYGEYCEMAERVSEAGVDMIEMNISCPNVKEGGVAFGARPENIRAITRAVKPRCGRTALIVKLSPNVESIAECAIAAREGGADCISLINTVTGMAVDVHTRRPILGNVTGGLSGPAIRPIALRMAWEACKAVDIPVIGMGGIECGEDAVAFLLVGCAAVQVGSANLYDPMACVRVAEGIEEYMRIHGIEDVSGIVGGLIL